MNLPTYRILRNTRHGSGWQDIIEAKGLCWEEAAQRRDRMTEEEIVKHPNKTSWTRDVFIIEMEKL